MFFDEDDRCKGYGTSKEIDAKDLETLVPDNLSGNWRDYAKKFKLEDGEIIFDEDYEPEQNT